MPFARDHLGRGDHAAQDLAGAVGVCAQGLFEVGQQLAVALQRVDHGAAGHVGILLCCHALTLGLCLLQAGRQGGGYPHRGHGIHQAGNLAIQLGDAGPGGLGQFGRLAPAGGEHFFYRFLQLGDGGRAQQFLADGVEQALVDLLAVGLHAGAHGRAAVLSGGAAVVTPAGGHHGAAADPALEQSAKQRSRSGALAGVAALTRRTRHALAHGQPQRVRHDLKLRALLDVPLVARAVDARPLAGVRVFHVLAAVPDQPSDVELVVEHAAALVRRAIQRRHRPGAAEAAFHAARVQIGRHALAAPALGIAGVDPADHLGLLGHHLEAADVAIAHAAVAVGPPAGVAAARELASEAAVRLLPQVVQVDFVDQPAHGAVDLAPGRLRVVAVGHADNADASVLQPAHGAFLFHLVAREAIQPLHDQHLEAPGHGIGQQTRAARAGGHRRRSRYGIVAVDGGNGEVEQVGAGLGDPRLIVKGSIVLPVG
nr:hypothetical protein [Denitromonas iodatirespirans]